MAQFASNFNWTNTLQSITKDRVISEYTVETKFKSQKFLSFMRQKGQLQQLTGGTGLAFGWNVNVGSSPNTIAFDGDDTLPINSMNANIIRAELDVKKYSDALVVLGTDSLLASGSPDSVADLIATQTDVVLMSIADALAGDIFTNTTALSSKKLTGLAEAIDDGTTSTTYAGISRTTYPTQWKSQTVYNVSATSTLGPLYKLDLQASIDAERPDAYFTNILAYQNVQTQLFTNDRYIQPDMARQTGGVDLMFNGNPVYIDSHAQTGVTDPKGNTSQGYFYMLNSSYNKLIVGPPGWYFDLTDWQMSQTNLTYFTRILFAGNLIIMKPSAQAVASIASS